MLVSFDSKNNLVRYTITGRVSEDLIDAVRKIQAEIPAEKKVRILARAENFSGYASITAVYKAIVLDLGWLGKADRYGLITDQKFLRHAVYLINYIVPGIDFRTFSPKKENEAKAWVSQEIKKID
ncbi:SpoIIAA family protein [Algoriphagus namhaensis]